MKNADKYLKILIVFTIAFMILFLILGVIMPAARAELAFHSETVNEPVYLTDNVSDSLNTVIAGLELKKAYLKSRLLASKSEAISLTVDLQDSTVSLQRSGVPLFTAKLSDFKKSAIFTKYLPADLSRWSEYPFTVVNSVSSIPKEPIIYKKAPKDTIEAVEQLKNHVIPDGLEDTWFRLYTDRNFKIIFKQTDQPAVGSNPGSRHRYFRKARKMERRELVNSLSKFEIPVCYSNITLYLSRANARVIYRALPEDALIVLKL